MHYAVILKLDQPSSNISENIVANVVNNEAKRVANTNEIINATDV